jgi:glycyl-tRNA synthetase
MDRIVALCKRRGFIFQSSEIYGGINGFWDYGPLGVELKRNLKDAWWRDVVHAREDVVGLDSSIIMHPRVWQSSGHADLFSDKMVDCRTCGSRFRLDQLESSQCPRRPKMTAGQGPECDLTEPRDFNLMFQTWVGAVRDDENMVSLRPETAQGIFVNFRNVCDSTRMKVPFGIAQVGKSFRNEITPRHFIFRSREFEQMELEFFCHPSEALEWYEYWCDARLQWYVDLGLPAERLQMRAHDPEELSHYSLGTSDIEYAYPFLEEGQFGELEGIAHRGDFDLRSHMEGKLVSQDGELVVEMTEDGTPKYKGSGKDLTYFDQERRERFTPNVIEPSAGADRALLAFVCEAYTVDESRPSPEIMRLHPRLAPIKAAVLPLVNKDGLPEIAEPLYQAVKKRWPTQYDTGGSIGKRYARMDEAGTPYCFTIDGQTKEDGTVTVRDRDTGHQDRISKDRVIEFLEEKLDC